MLGGQGNISNSLFQEIPDILVLGNSMLVVFVLLCCQNVIREIEKQIFLTGRVSLCTFFNWWWYKRVCERTNYALNAAAASKVKDFLIVNWMHGIYA